MQAEWSLRSSEREYWGESNLLISMIGGVGKVEGSEVVEASWSKRMKFCGIVIFVLFSTSSFTLIIFSFLNLYTMKGAFWLEFQALPSVLWHHHTPYTPIYLYTLKQKRSKCNVAYTNYLTLKKKRSNSMYEKRERE